MSSVISPSTLSVADTPLVGSNASSKNIVTSSTPLNTGAVVSGSGVGSSGVSSTHSPSTSISFSPHSSGSSFD